MGELRAVPTDTREQALQVRETWHNLGTTATYGDMTLAEFDAQLAALDEATKMLTRMEDQVAAVREELHEKKRQVWESVKRTRLSAKLKHGDDSVEYERFGGTRLSAYKRRKPTAKPA